MTLWLLFLAWLANTLAAAIEWLRDHPPRLALTVLTWFEDTDVLDDTIEAHP